MIYKLPSQNNNQTKVMFLSMELYRCRRWVRYTENSVVQQHMVVPNVCDWEVFGVVVIATILSLLYLVELEIHRNFGGQPKDYPKD